MFLSIVLIQSSLLNSYIESGDAMSPGSFAGDHDHVIPHRYIWSVQCLLIVLMLPFCKQ